MAPPLDAPARGSEADLTLDYLLRRMRFKSDFPALSASVSRVQALSQSDTDSMQAFCDEVLQDLALTQKLLRVVNTAHFRRAGVDPISTVSRAVALIGVGGVRNMAMSLMLLDHMSDKVHAQQLKVEFLRAVMAGTLASELSHHGREAEEAYLGALFRKLGRLLVSFYLPDDAQQIRELSSPTADGLAPVDEAQAAIQVLGVSLDKLANKVGHLWGLPEGLLACMALPGEHIPTHSLRGRFDRSCWLASLANDAADAMLQAEPGQLGEALSQLSIRYAQALDLAPDELAEAAGRARKRLAELTHAINMGLPTHSPAERLLDHYYVDAPHASPLAADGAAIGPHGLHGLESLHGEQGRQSQQGQQGSDRPAGSPHPDALAWLAPDALSLGPDDGALIAPMPLPMADRANMLTNGIQDITNTLLENFRLEDVLHMILETMLRALDCRRVIFCLRDPKGGALLGRMGLGEGVDVLKAAFKIPLVIQPGRAPDLFTVVCLKSADMLIADAAAPAIAGRLPAWFSAHVQAPTFLLLPLTLKRKGQPDMVVGLIYADMAKAGSLQLSDKELSLLRTLRNQAVMAFKQSAGA